MLNVDAILTAMNDWRVNYLLIGGVNFMLNHEPVLTSDVDLWVEEAGENLARLQQALLVIGAEWGQESALRKPIPLKPDWLQGQEHFFLTSRHGALNVYRVVKGLENKYEEAKWRASLKRTSSGVAYRSLSDQDMLTCQLALPLAQQKPARIARLQAVLAATNEQHQRANQRQHMLLQPSSLRRNPGK